MLTYQNYTASLWVDEKAALICGKVDNISRDSLPFQGRTVEEAKKEFTKTIDRYLEFCKKENVEPEKPMSFSGKLPFRTSPEIHRSLYYKAKQAHKSINAWLEEVANKALEEDAVDQNKGKQAENPSELFRKLEKQPPELMDRFFDQVAPHLKNSGPVGTIKLLSAVEKVLPGLDEIRLQLKQPDSKTMVKVVSAIAAWVEEAKADSNQGISVPFVKEEQESGRISIRR